MKNFQNVAIAATMTFGLLMLGGCQSSQTGSSTHMDASSSKSLKTTTKRITNTITSPQPRLVSEDAAIIANSAVGMVALSRPAKSKMADRKKLKKLSHKSKKSRRLTAKRGTLKGDRVKRNSYDRLIRRYARAYGVPYKLARAVVQVESGFKASARGGVGEIGLMQLRKSTARGMGYRGSTKGLYNPETNIKYGMRYLGKAYKLGGGSTCGAILKYNAGHAAKRMNPISKRYCGKVRKIMRGRV